MLKKIRKRMTYANVMATIAVFAALGMGSAYAATKLTKGSVTTKSIKNNAVKGTKIANNAVSTAKIANGAVTAAKAGAGVLRGHEVRTDTAPYNGDNHKGTEVSCPAGKKIVGGGTVITRDANSTEVALVADGPNPSGSSTTWISRGAEIPHTGSTGNWNMQTTIYCAAE
jgi:hypothetical protein